MLLIGSDLKKNDVFAPLHPGEPTKVKPHRIHPPSSLAGVLGTGAT
jgi:hypothetical protein